MSIRRAHKLQVQHAKKLDVVEDLAAAAKEAVVLLPRQLFANPSSTIVSRAHVASLLNRQKLFLPKCRLQAVNQLLHIFFPERLEQPACNGRQTSENLCFALPRDFRATGCRNKIEACCQRHVSARHTSPPPVLGPGPPIRFCHLHLPTSSA